MEKVQQQQTRSMVHFILSEAKHKAEEIEAMTTQAFTLEKGKVLSAMKAKVRREYESKEKKIESQRAISRSRIVNESRLQKVAKRGELLDAVTAVVQGKLKTVTQDSKQYGNLLTDLIVQGALVLLEPEVKVRCREMDVKLVKSVLQNAEAEFAKVVKTQSGAAKTVSLSIDTSKYLPAPASKQSNTNLGGVVLACHGGLITVDNTLDVRLKMIVEQDKPAIRSQLFQG